MFSLIDTFWVILAAMLVFFMNLGFASVESGMQNPAHTLVLDCNTPLRY